MCVSKYTCMLIHQVVFKRQSCLATNEFGSGSKDVVIFFLIQCQNFFNFTVRISFIIKIGKVLCCELPLEDKNCNKQIPNDSFTE